MTYNSLDLVGKNSNNGANFVNYSYLSDGTKLSALTAVEKVLCTGDRSCTGRVQETETVH